MEKALLDNDHKGGWKDCSYEFLFERIGSNLIELKYELMANKWDERTVPEAIKHAVDIANFAMMIADNARKEMGK
jgi:hypothetical protein